MIQEHKVVLENGDIIITRIEVKKSLLGLIKKTTLLNSTFLKKLDKPDLYLGTNIVYKK